MTKPRSLKPAELAEMEAGFTKWLNMPDIGHEPYGAFIAGYMLGRMSEIPLPHEPKAPQATLLEHFREVIVDFDARIANGLRTEYSSPICVRRDVVEAMRSALNRGAEGT